MSGQGGRPAHAVDMPDMQGSVRWAGIQIYRIYIYFFFGPYTVLYLSRVNSDPGCTAKTQYRKFETNISRKRIARLQSQFPHSCVCCERYMYSRCRYAIYARIRAVGQHTNLPDLYIFFLCTLQYFVYQG
jgi:hypothetical protein